MLADRLRIPRRNPYVPVTLFSGANTSPFINRFLVTPESLTSMDGPDVGAVGSSDNEKSIASHPNGIMAFALRAEGVRVFQYSAGSWSTLQSSLASALSWVHSVSLHPTDAKWLLVASTQVGSTVVSLYERITISGVDAYYMRNYLFTTSNANSRAVFSPDGTMIAVGYLSTVFTFQFNATTGAITSVESLTQGQFARGMAWSPNSLYLAVSNESDSPRFKIFKRDIADDTMTALTIDTYHPKSIPTSGNNIAWHPGNQIVVVGSSDAESTIYAYQNNGDDTFSDVTGTMVSAAVGVGGRIYAVDWSLDGTLLAVGIADGSLQGYVIYTFNGTTLTRAYATGSSGVRDLLFHTFDATPTAVTLDNSTATANTMAIAGSAVLSGGDLTVTMPAGDTHMGRSTQRIKGKRYIEFSTTFNGLMIGVCNENSPYGWNNGGNNAAYYFVGSGTNYQLLTGGAAASDSALLVGGVCGIAIDTLARKLWLRDETGTFWNGDPVAGTGGWAFEFLRGGEIRLAVGQGSGTTETAVTINFGATAFTHAVPTGFNT